jgi:hypothetical protein
MEPITPVTRSNWVRRPEDKRRKNEPERRGPRKPGPGEQDRGGDADERPHIIDELA